MSKKHPIVAYRNDIATQIKASRRYNETKRRTIVDDIDAVKPDAPTRPFVVQCRKCGVPNSCSFQVSNIKDGNRPSAFSAEIIVLLVCRACGYSIDRCDIHVIVPGIGTWQVLKKHVA